MKRQRHEVVVDLINKYDIETQEELAAYLKEEGFEVTQATVSRDIRELKLSKIATGNGKQKYIILKNDDSHLGDKYIRVLRDGFVSMNMAQNILVIKTVSGMAMAVAAALDALKWKEILGSRHPHRHARNRPDHDHILTYVNRCECIVEHSCIFVAQFRGRT